VAPVKPVINYKLTPIAETAFEISNHQSIPIIPTAKPPQVIHVEEQPVVRDPISNAVHKANRFEYTRSTQKPSVKYESYEWTTPTSLRNDKVNVNFNVMSPQDITEEINNKKHIFTDHSIPYKPLDTPLNKPSFFPPIGDVFRHYHPKPKKTTPRPWTPEPSTEATPLLHELANAPEDHEEEPSTTVAPWPVVDDRNLAKLANDTNEYIMLMLNKQMGAHDDKAYEAN